MEGRFVRHPAFSGWRGEGGGKPLDVFSRRFCYSQGWDRQLLEAGRRAPALRLVRIQHRKVSLVQKARNATSPGLPFAALCDRQRWAAGAGRLGMDTWVFSLSAAVRAHRTRARKHQPGTKQMSQHRVGNARADALISITPESRGLRASSTHGLGAGTEKQGVTRVLQSRPRRGRDSTPGWARGATKAPLSAPHATEGTASAPCLMCLVLK